MTINNASYSVRTFVNQACALTLVFFPWASTSFGEERQFVTSENLTFGSADDFTVAVELSDLDQDGDLDAVVINGRHWARQDRIMFNNGSGQFLVANALGNSLATGYRPAIADLDGDGAMDIVVARDRVPSHMFINRGGGSFVDIGPVGPVGPTRAILAPDVNLDQKVDLVFSIRGESNQILYGPSYAESYTFDHAEQTVRLAAADLNGDSYPDLVFANIGPEGNSILFNDGHGSFPELKRTNQRFGPSVDVAIGDINGDTLPDIVFASIGVNTIFLNDDNQAFETVVEFGKDTGQSYGVALGDLNNDGRTDIVIANAGSPNVVYFNHQGNLVENILNDDFDAMSYGVSIGDLDGNGFQDLVFANSGTMSRIYLNEAIEEKKPR